MMKPTIPWVREGDERYGEEEDDEKRVENAVPVDAGGLFAEVTVAVVVEAIRPGRVGRKPVDGVGVDDVDLLRMRGREQRDVVCQRRAFSTDAHCGNA